ncbi:DUF1573 domain-containing protein [Aquimarina hainanensis]|uniref:DUF1573 domain-containing protein n=1 Tax=Aquimarina hainanensis TaxID=1578017 RepID=A0ABW5N8A1_9FLAO|nr:DUF1573 domain-containing protein [Aquimarina sp. TRL1]QKX05755.1 DUF1573 domain-containing protein [Aquimarina sp. TRL1]
MKNGILILAGVLAMTFVSCKEDASKKVKEESVDMAAERDAKNTEFPVMTFAETEFDFGTINEGDVVDHTFKFTNTGKAPLVIVNAKGSCGCTVPSYSKDPIAPGETGELLVKFNSNGKPNQQNKQVTITANTEAGKEIIKIKALVTPKAKPVSGTPVSE